MYTYSISWFTAVVPVEVIRNLLGGRIIPSSTGNGKRSAILKVSFSVLSGLRILTASDVKLKKYIVSQYLCEVRLTKRKIYIVKSVILGTWKLLRKQL